MYASIPGSVNFRDAVEVFERIILFIAALSYATQLQSQHCGMWTCSVVIPFFDLTTNSVRVIKVCCHPIVP